MISDDLIFKLWACSLFGAFSNTKLCENLAHIKPHQLERLLLPCFSEVPVKLKKYAENELKLAREKQINILSPWHKDYPLALLEISDPPLLLFVQGTLKNSQEAFAIVGSRRCSDYGKKYAALFSKLLAENNLTVVSGLATGIDAAAHRAAIESGAYPGVGVLGCGLDIFYPAHNKILYQLLLQNGGAIISEFGLLTKPRNYLFPRRNRIISGLSKTVFVIEASEKSGSLITARLANEQGRDVLALPGPIDSDVSVGCNRLISEGAKIVYSKQDFINYLQDTNLIKKYSEVASSNSELLLELRKNSHTVESLSQKLNQPLSRIYGELLTMEIKGELKIGITGEIELSV